MKKTAGGTLNIVWEDGHESGYPLTYLRDSCPCASCAGETILFRTYAPPPPDLSTPGRYDLVNIQLVGAYAAQLYWADGHNTGIYTWEKLLAMCPCPGHSPAGGATS